MGIKVWFVRDGPDPTWDAPAYELPLKSCIEILGLTRRHWKSDLDPMPTFGDQTSRLSLFTEPRHVVCEIDEAQASVSGLKAGFYMTDLTPDEAIERLGQPNEPLDM